jgi:rod shape-determining protein MreC
MDRSPPPFFNQGPSAHARLAFFALLAIALLVTDSRVGALAALRQGLGTVLYPLQRTLLVPRDLLALGADYVSDVNRLRAETAELRRIETANARALLRAEQLAAENAKLRELLGARERSAIRTVIAEVLYDTRDPYTRRLVLDRGLQHGVLAGQPVIDAQGVVGQITRVLPLSSEVTLLTDRAATIPVEVTRTGQRSLAFGGAALPGMLELRFLNAGSDLREGDVLATSGLDGIYPPGLPVGTIASVEPGAGAGAGLRVLVRPVAAIERSRLMLVLLVDQALLPQPPAVEPPADTRRRKGREAP